MNSTERYEKHHLDDYPMGDDLTLAIDDLIEPWERKSRLQRQTDLRRRIESRIERRRLMDELGQDPGELDWDHWA